MTTYNASQKGIFFSQMPDSSDYEGNGRPLQIQDAAQIEHAHLRVCFLNGSRKPIQSVPLLLGC